MFEFLNIDIIYYLWLSRFLVLFCWLHTSQNSDDHRCSCSLVNNTTKTMRHAQDISRVLFCIALIAFIADRVADGHKSFQAKIPNGGKEIAGSTAMMIRTCMGVGWNYYEFPAGITAVGSHARVRAYGTVPG